jgi:hypothetical protein
MERDPDSWLALAAGGSPLRMKAEWMAALGPLHCEQCGAPIREGDAFELSAYCSMGGPVAIGGHASLYSDTLEVRARHVPCP